MTDRFPFPDRFYAQHVPTNEERMARAIVLLTRTQAENFDRTLPGCMFRGSWRVRPDHESESVKHSLACYAASRFTADFLEVARQFEDELARDHSRRGGHDRDVEELTILSSEDWFEDVDRTFAEALARELTRRGLAPPVVKHDTKQ